MPYRPPLRSGLGEVESTSRNAELPDRQLGGLGGPEWRQWLARRPASRRRARTRGFAAPAFAGCAFVVLRSVEVRATLRVGTEDVKPDRVSGRWLDNLCLTARHKQKSQGRVPGSVNLIDL